MVWLMILVYDVAYDVAYDLAYDLAYEDRLKAASLSQSFREQVHH